MSPLIAISTVAFFGAAAVLVLAVFSPSWGAHVSSFLQVLAGLCSFFIAAFLVTKRQRTPERSPSDALQESQKAHSSASGASGAAVITCTVLFAVSGILLLNLYVWYLPEVLKSSWPVGTAAALNSGRAHIIVAAFAGLIAGLVASVPEVIAYMLEVRRILITMDDNIWNHRPSEFFQVFAPLALFVVLVGAVLAMSMEAAWQLTAHLRWLFGNLYLVIGGVAGGTFAGLTIGPIGAWYFGRKNLPIANPCASVIAAIPGLIGVVLITASGKGLSPLTVQMAAIISLVICALVALWGAMVGQLVKLDQRIMAIFANSSEKTLLLGGIWFGVFCGATFGLAISLSLFIADFGAI